MLIIQNRFSDLILGKGYGAVTIFPFIFIHTDVTVTERLLNHERIHCRQQLEMLWLPFFLWYGIEWCIRAIRDRQTACERLSLEQEAYQHEQQDDYFFERKPFSWIRYLNK